MKKIKKALRVLGLILLIILAVSGIGIGAIGFIDKRKEQDTDNEVKTELVEGHENQLREKN